jgi:hypothetical protein
MGLDMYLKATKHTYKYEYESKEDELYRQFFRYNIENDSSEVYGAGFRRARVCEEKLSLQVLLEYIGENQLFPGI